MHSQTTEYALRAMACLAARPNQLVPTSTLSEQTRTPPDYLAKVLQLLSGAQLIDSRRGVGGGYRLTRAASSISMLDIINAVNGKIVRIHDCPLGLPTHSNGLCPLHKLADRAAAAMIEIYGSCTLADLTTHADKKPPLCEPADLTVNGAATN